MQAIRALPNFQARIRGEETTFRSWLMTIARNAVIGEWRRAPSTTPLDTLSDSSVFTDRSPTPEDHAISRDEQEEVMSALAQLSPVQRKIVELRLAGLKAAEIAELLDMSVSAVNTAHFRAYARLRNVLGTTQTSGKGISS